MKNIVFLYAFALLLAIGCSPKISAPKQPKPPTPPNVPSTANHDFRKVAPSGGPAPKIQIAKAQTFKLENGLEVIVVPNNKLPRVSFQVFVDYDPVLEKNASGYVEMMGGLLSKGTSTMTKAQIDEKIDFIGAGFSSDQNGLSGNCLTKHAETLLGILSDVLLNPAFPEAELKKLKLRKQSALAQDKDDANTIAENTSAVLSFGKNHPYGELPDEKSLEAITIDQIKKHYSTYFKPNVSYLVIVGDITKAQAETWSKKYFSQWKQGQVPTHNYTEPTGPKQAEVSFVHKPGAVQSVINITYPLNLKPGTADVIPSAVMNTILGGYFNSRLNQNLREGKAYTYGARSSINPDELGASFKAFASVRNEVTDSSIVEFLKEMKRMRTEPVKQDELSIVQSVMTGNFANSLERPETVARFALNTARYKLPADYYETYLQKLNSVTPVMVQAMANKYLKPEQAYLLVVGEKVIAEKLGWFSTDQKVRFYDGMGQPIVENTTKIPENMTPQKVVAAYIAAIGGEASLKKVDDISMDGSLKAGMPADLTVKSIQKKGNKLFYEISMNQNIMIRELTDGKTGKSEGMGGSNILAGEELADIKRRAIMFPELEYSKDIYNLQLKGIETINGANAYCVEINDLASNTKQTNYYDMATGFKLREVRIEGTGVEAQRITVDFKDYKTAGAGILMPFGMSINGVFPTTAQVVYSNIAINSKIPDSQFEVK
jgi:zinc protease